MDTQELTLSQVRLLYNMVKASIIRASSSGIPVSDDTWNEIEKIKSWLIYMEGSILHDINK